MQTLEPKTLEPWLPGSALRMPRLHTLVLWNDGKGNACGFIPAEAPPASLAWSNVSLPASMAGLYPWQVQLDMSWRTWSGPRTGSSAVVPKLSCLRASANSYKCDRCIKWKKPCHTMSTGVGPVGVRACVCCANDCKGFTGHKG
jgi:hypothetical protein